MRKLLAFIFLLSPCAMACEVVSLVKIISSPQNYDGKCIQTVGVISVAFEENLLYLNKESYAARAYENAIIQPVVADSVDETESDKMKNLFKTYEGKLVRFTGIYSAKGAFRPTINVNGWFTTVDKLEIIEGSNSFPPKT
jgi:hypothetical protein|tara:strand:+ start:63 stop:482 length:420 start_codon:yes stop_codon:yes gene_type:complete